MARKLSPEQFVLKAVEVLPSGEQRSKHKGVRRRDLEAPFETYFDGEVSLDETINSLIQANKIVAVRLVWKGSAQRGTIAEVVRLNAFPDKKITEANPMLYLPSMLPDRLTRRLSWAQEAIKKILDS